ncbi:MAG: hypothetical protein IKX77_00145, partial [Clostridia bacterium]|nr:hypothetical protein [Clostridia bacterium]
MNTEKYTQKTMEAIRKSSSLAGEYGNQQITALHIFAGVLADPQGLICELMTKMGVKPSEMYDE